MNFWNKYKSLALVIVLTYLISLPAGLATSQSVGTWYVNIIKPSFNPPNWVFAPVWTMLYSLMSVAVWNVWNGLKETNKSIAIKIMSIYFFHLLVGASWSFAFFVFHQIFLSVCVIILIILFIIWLMKTYWLINKASFYLMIPYLLWSSFALILNISIWKLN